MSEDGGLEKFEKFLESGLLIRQTLPPASEFRRPFFQVQRYVADSTVFIKFDRRSLAAGRIIERTLPSV